MDTERTLVGRLTLTIYIGREGDGWRLTTDKGMQSCLYDNKWLAMQDYLHGTVNWEREYVRDVPNGGSCRGGDHPAPDQTTNKEQHQ